MQGSLEDVRATNEHLGRSLTDFGERLSMVNISSYPISPHFSSPQCVICWSEGLREVKLIEEHAKSTISSLRISSVVSDKTCLYFEENVLKEILEIHIT